MGLDHNSDLESVEKLKLTDQRVVGMYCGYFHASLLVEYENGERQVVGWGYDSRLIILILKF